jgi:hypothetical protein
MIIHDLLEKKEFVEAVHYSLEKIIKIFLVDDIPFSILTNIKYVDFEPKLPKEISGNFKPITMFELCGYTLSSASLKNKVLSFEAGFGENDFASLVSVPLFAILQISVGDTPVFINMAIQKADEEEKVEKKDDNSKRSMQALLNNPENKNLFKK